MFIAYTLAVPFISTLTDVGPIVKALLANPTEWLDDEILLVSEALTPAEVAAAYSKVHGIPTRHVIVDSIPAMEAMPWMKEMFVHFRTVGFFPKYFGGREHELNVKAKMLYPGMKTLEQWFSEVGRLDNSKPSWG